VRAVSEYALSHFGLARLEAPVFAKRLGSCARAFCTIACLRMVS
jgi:hypothetical protein